MSKIVFICEFCKSKVLDWPSRNRRFCGDGCHNLWQAENSPRGQFSPHWKGGKPKCIDCSIQLNSCYSTRCKKCEDKRRKGIPTKGRKRFYCKQCEQEFFDFPSRGRVFCCRACFTAWKKENWIGENSPTWRGGITTKVYPSSFSGKLKELIRERDRRICVVCGAEEVSRLHSVHHIDYDKSNNDPSNLITLCGSCHSKTNSKRKYWRLILTPIARKRCKQ